MAVRWAVLGVAVGLALSGCGGSSSGPTPGGGLVGLPFLVFPANSTDGFEPWVTDGTPAGTYQLRDINTDPTSSLQGFYLADRYVWMGGLAFFAATDTDSDTELWQSDGTESGTVRTEDINTMPNGAGTMSSSPGQMRAIGTYLYFSADDGVVFSEPYRTDGTTVQLLGDVNNPGSSGPTEFTGYAGGAVFRASGLAAANALWVYNGTDPPSLVAGTENTIPNEFATVGSDLFFSANDGSSGYELWKYDGVTAAMVKDISGGAQPSLPAEIVDLNGMAVFRASTLTDAELWKSDGTLEGTTLVEDINSTGPSFPRSLIVVDGAVYFAADPGTGHSLYKYDGVSVTLVKSLGDANSLLYPGAGPYFYFIGDEAGTPAIWRSDGTTEGTVDISSQLGAFDDCSQVIVGVVNGKLVFSFDSEPNGLLEPWVTDGTPEGTIQLSPAQFPGYGGCG